jgi:hypothetical protein
MHQTNRQKQAEQAGERATRMKLNAVTRNQDEDLLSNDLNDPDFSKSRTSQPHLELWREYVTGLRQGGSSIIRW